MVPPYHHHHVNINQQQRYHPAYLQSHIGAKATLLAAAAAEKPTILLQAVIELGERTRDGHIIVGVAPAWTEIIRLIEQDPGILFKIDPRKLEEMIAGAYEKDGWDEVILTPRSGDHGRDVIASRRDWGRVRATALNFIHFCGAGDDFRKKSGVLSGQLSFARNAFFQWMMPQDT